MKKILVLVALLCGMASCVKDVEFNGEQSDPVLVVNGVQQAGKTANLCIEKSWFFLDSEIDFRVKDVEVDLYVNGSFKESLQVRDSLADYAFTYCEGRYELCEGDRLRFEVRSSEFETAYAEVTLPESPTVISFDTVSVDLDYGTIEFAVEIDDPVGADFYNLYFYNAFEVEYSVYSFYSSDPVFTDPLDLGADDLMGETSDYYGGGLYNVFADTYFDGRTYTVNFTCYAWDMEFLDPFVIEMSRVNESLYKYQKTAKKYQENDPNGIIGMFAEPVQVYTNVENGVGIVSGQSKPVVMTMDFRGNKKPNQ